MIGEIKASNFKAVPYLEGSALMQRHPEGLRFSTTQPNVIVGPNGAGKSALMTTLANLTLSNLLGRSCLDANLTSLSPEGELLWSKAEGWGNSFCFLPGLEAKTDDGPALYYRPGHVPGNETSATHALFTGYGCEAQAFINATKNHSSGEQGQALLAGVRQALAGDLSGFVLSSVNWRFGVQERDPQGQHFQPWDFQANHLLKRFMNVPSNAKPVLLLDEPEQSLDALAEAALWRAIASADCDRMQIIVATHSMHPFIFPECFNVIEAAPGYVREVCAAAGL